MADSKLGDIIATSLSEIKNVADVNTIIGDSITTPTGTVIIPVSKVSLGFASGGVDFDGKNPEETSEKKKKPLTFSGGGGTGMTVTPVAFLVISADGKVNLLNVENPPESPDVVGSITGLIEKSPDIIGKLKDIFQKKDSAEKID